MIGIIVLVPYDGYAKGAILNMNGHRQKCQKYRSLNSFDVSFFDINVPLGIHRNLMSNNNLHIIRPHFKYFKFSTLGFDVHFEQGVQ